MAPKMGPPHSPSFGTYGGHFCGRSETRFNGIGGPKLGPPKTQIETQNWCQFLSPSFDTICLPRDAISKYINQSSVPGWNSTGSKFRAEFTFYASSLEADGANGYFRMTGHMDADDWPCGCGRICISSSRRIDTYITLYNNFSFGLSGIALIWRAVTCELRPFACRG